MNETTHAPENTQAPENNLDNLKTEVETAMWSAFGIKVNSIEVAYGLTVWSLHKNPPNEEGVTTWKFSFRVRNATVVAGGENPVHAAQEAEHWLSENNWETVIDEMEPGVPYRVEGYEGVFTRTSMASPQHQNIPHFILYNVKTSNTLVVPPGLGCSKTTWDTLAAAPVETPPKQG